MFYTAIFCIAFVTLLAIVGDKNRAYIILATFLVGGINLFISHALSKVVLYLLILIILIYMLGDRVRAIFKPRSEEEKNKTLLNMFYVLGIFLVLLYLVGVSNFLDGFNNKYNIIQSIRYEWRGFTEFHR